MSLDTTLRPLRSDADFDAALQEYEGYFDQVPEPDTEAAYRFEVLGLLLTKYEEDTTRSPRRIPLMRSSWSCRPRARPNLTSPL